MRLFLDTERRELITEKELENLFRELKAADPDTYDYDFESYIGNCTDKNGALIEIRQI